MRSAMAVAGSTAVLVAVVLAGCGDGETSGAPVPGAATTTTGSGSAETNTEAVDGPAAAAGDWREDAASGTAIMAHVDSDGGITLDYGTRKLKGRLVWLAERHFRILLIAPSGVEPPRVTADLSDDGQTFTVHSSDEDGPVIYKRV